MELGDARVAFRILDVCEFGKQGPFSETRNQSDFTTRTAILPKALRSLTLTSPRTNSSAFVILFRPMITMS